MLTCALPIGKAEGNVYIHFMHQKQKRRIAARLVFIIGLSLMILGVVFLFASLEGSPRAGSSREGSYRLFVFLSFLLVITGAFLAVFAIRLNKSATYLFFASFFLMAGIFLFLSALKIVPLPFSKAWPLLSIFSGLALLPVGWRRCGGFRKRYIVSSCAFVILGCMLLIFSLKIVPFSFRSFIQAWWPLLFLLAGLTLILISISAKGEKRG